MKSLGKWPTFLALMALLIGCGKENKSGRSAVDQFGNPLVSPYGLPFGANIANINSPYSYGGYSLNQVMAENPCISGFGGYPGMGGAYSGQRIPIQIPLVNFPTVIAPNDVYVGVTSYGDVAAVVGTSPGQPPLFVGYLCPRSFIPNGQGQLVGVKIGAYSNCLFKPISAATVVFPGSNATADFRMMDFGSSMRTKFSFCR